MLLSPSPRGSLSIPVHINLRRRRTRELLQYPSSVPESQWRRHRGGGDGGGEKAKAQVPVSSVGEERALLLGFIMMAFSILMYFVVGIVVVKPCIHSDWGDATNCSLIQAEFLNEPDERGSSYPCLQVLVNITAETSGKTLHLRYDEAAVNLSPECFYTPKNHQNKSDVVGEARRIKDALCKLQEQGQAVRCHLSNKRYPEDAILTKRHNLRLALQCLVWPSLMLFGGALLVGLVMLTQYLAYLCNETIQKEEGMEDGQSTAGKNKLYRFMPCRPWSPSIEEED
ncbi:calcium-activated potassium channel subunit beta-3 [Pangasianodon hypophthalmus]|uniref:calcium-activated potassium channel subunit beta-3 n=1 Tax=Pangasianodon hypophthalmus TaxID=310915 RepID=UPI0023074816|nr:calcium-activated potassium channel subunit beta-3 [Pangasianodon hypophthalmus]